MSRSLLPPSQRMPDLRPDLQPELRSSLQPDLRQPTPQPVTQKRRLPSRKLGNASMRVPGTAVGLVAALGAALGGCASDSERYSYIPFVYQIDVQQGNAVTQEMLAQLKPGMNRNQVRFVMGTPLVQDTFHTNRWDYLYTFQKGGGDRERRLITLVFEEDVLAYVEGDVKAAPGRLDIPLRNDTIVEVPKAPPSGLVGRLSNMFRDEEAAAEAEPTEPGSSAETDMDDEADLALPGDLYGRSASTDRAVGEEVEAELSERRKGVFGRMLDRFGLGDRETTSADTEDELIYRDPTDPESMEREP